MNFTKTLLFIFIFFGCFTTYAQKTQKEETLKTLTFTEVEKLQQENPKPIVVFISTEWCKICFGMKRTTFQNKDVIQLLNNNFYFIHLNGEEKETLLFYGKEFNYKPTGVKTGVHELAIALAGTDKRIAYPTTTILNTSLEITTQIVGYIKSREMKRILKKY